jgi:predicted TIM-barrel fold metal-dependent hydrolase
MMYDVHTHVGLDTGFYLRGWWPYAATATDLLSQMDAHEITRAVCFPFTLPSSFDTYAFAERNTVELLPGRFPFDRENQLLAQEIERVDTDHRLIQFFMFDPSRKVPEQVKELQRLAPKIKGLKTQSTVLRSPISALLKEGRDLMLFAEQHNLPVLFHTSYIQTDQWAQIRDCIAVAEAFPKVRFNLAHSLRFSLDDLKRAAQLPNVWVDCSAHLNHCRLAMENSPIIPPTGKRVDADYSKPAQAMQAVHAILGGKYLWGSDNPFMSWCDDKLRLIFSYRQEVEVLKSLPRQIWTDMATTAPKAWLGL